MRRKLDVMRAAAESAGRDPDAIEVTTLGRTRAERIEMLTRAGVHRMLLFAADVGTVPALGEHVNNIIADAS